MPRRVRNPGSGKAPVNTPASGIPAGGTHSEGWGGPAKGAGKGPAYGPTTAETFEILRAKKASAPPEVKAKRKKAKADKAARVEQFNDHLADLALNAAREETQVSATIALLNRLDGMPRQRNENENRDMTLEMLIMQAASSGKKSDASGA